MDVVVSVRVQLLPGLGRLGPAVERTEERDDNGGTLIGLGRDVSLPAREPLKHTRMDSLLEA